MNVTLTMASVVTSVRIPREVTNVNALNRSTWIQQIRELVEVSNEREMTHISYYSKGLCHQHSTVLGQFCAQVGSLYVSGKLPTYPSPKPTLPLTSHLGQNVGLGEGQVEVIT